MLASCIDNGGKKLETFTEQMIDTATSLKQQTQAKLDALKQELEQKYQTTSLTNELSDAKLVLEKTKRATTDSNNQSQQIVCSSLAAIKTRKSIKVYTRLECPDITDISFIPHVAHEKLFASLLTHNSMGDFRTVHRVMAADTKVEGTSLDLVEPTSGPYVIKKTGKGKSEMAGDIRNSFVLGACSLHDGTILLADYNNLCIKRVSPFATSPSDSLLIPGHARICYINEQEAAVTIPHNSQVQMISLGQTMKAMRRFKVDLDCCGIAYHDGELFIANTTSVYVYDITGTKLRKLTRNKRGVTLFSNIYNLAVSASGRKLFVADTNNGVVAVDSKTGRKVWQYKADDLVNASDVCTDGRGSVFICGGNSHNVLEFSEEGERLGETVRKEVGVTYPTTLCFDTAKSTLVVTMAFGSASSEVVRFTLTKQ